MIRALMRLRWEGLVIGLTVTGPKQGETIRRALEIRVDGVTCFQAVQATWNLLETSAGSALGEAHAQGCGVILKEVMTDSLRSTRNVTFCSGP